MIKQKQKQKQKSINIFSYLFVANFFTNKSNQNKTNK